MVFRGTAEKRATNKKAWPKTAFYIKTTQDMLGLTCRDFSLLFTGTSPDCWNRQTIFNSCLIGLAPLMRVMHIYHEWTTPAHPPNTVARRPHMPKHPFMLTTQKKSRDFLYLFWLFFFFFILSLHSHCTNLIMLLNSHTKLRGSESFCCGGIFIVYILRYVPLPWCCCAH